MTVKEAQKRTELLKEVLPTVKRIISDLFIDDLQTERLNDCFAELIAIAETEIYHAIKVNGLQKI